MVSIAEYYDDYVGGYSVSLGSESGYGDELYYPYQTDDFNSYWLASPSAGEGSGERVLGVLQLGKVLGAFCDYGTSCAVRPVVCLKSDIKGLLEGDTWMLSTN